MPEAGTWHLVYHQNLTSGVSLKRAFTPFLTFVHLSKCNIKLSGIFGNSKRSFLWTGLLHTHVALGKARVGCVDWLCRSCYFVFFICLLFFVKWEVTLHWAELGLTVTTFVATAVDKLWIFHQPLRALCRCWSFGHNCQKLLTNTFLHSDPSGSGILSHQYLKMWVTKWIYLRFSTFNHEHR